MEWLLEHLKNASIPPEHAPCPAAGTMLAWVRQSDQNLTILMERWMGPLPTRAGIERQKQLGAEADEAMYELIADLRANKLEIPDDAPYEPEDDFP